MLSLRLQLNITFVLLTIIQIHLMGKEEHSHNKPKGQFRRNGTKPDRENRDQKGKFNARRSKGDNGRGGRRQEAITGTHDERQQKLNGQLNR